MSLRPQPPTDRVFDFAQQKAVGLSGEEVLDHYFRHIYEVVPAEMEDQRRGIDRWFHHRETGGVFAVEYKVDTRAAETSNAFIEIETNGKGEGSGWAFTSLARMLAYYCPGTEGEIAYWIRLVDLRVALPKWLRAYPAREVKNVHYVTKGLIVPLSEFERICLRAINI